RQRRADAARREGSQSSGGRRPAGRDGRDGRGDRTDAHASVGLSGLQAAGVYLSQVREVEGPTGLAIVTVAQDGENSIVVIPAANSAMDAGRVSAAGEMISRAAIVVCQGEIPRSGIEALPSLITGRFLHNPAPVMELDPAVLRASDPLVVNEH